MLTSTHTGQESTPQLTPVWSTPKAGASETWACNGRTGSGGLDSGHPPSLHAKYVPIHLMPSKVTATWHSGEAGAQSLTLNVELGRGRLALGALYLDGAAPGLQCPQGTWRNTEIMQQLAWLARNNLGLEPVALALNPPDPPLQWKVPG